MSIKTPPPPRDSFEKLLSGLSRLPLSATGGAGMSEGVKGTPDISYPHKVYNLGLEDIAAGKGIDTAQLVSWRYLVDRGQLGTAAAEVNYDERTGTNEFSQLNQGSYGLNTVEEIKKVEKSPQFRERSYELRFLRVPALYVAALWLHDLDGDHDVVIPIPPTDVHLKPGVDYVPSKFIALLQAPAQQKLRFDSSPRMEQAR